MNDIWQCPSCKEKIENDFRYCDQCGKQIMVCSLCGRPGDRNRCKFDGKELIPAGNSKPIQTTQSPQPVPHVQTIQPPQSMPPVQPVQAVFAPVQLPQQNIGDKVKLTSQIHGIMIEVKDGDIIGRKNGAFTSVFARFNFVSGTHCKFVKNAGGWHIQDMGSTNGTFYNGGQLAPNALYPILSNTTIKIADIELFVTYDINEGGTARL